MQKNPKLKALPKFASEKTERAFWEKPGNDSTAYLDWRDAQPAIFPQVKLTTAAISLRLPEGMLAEIKTAANKRDVPYQSLIKMWLAEHLSEQAQRPTPTKSRRMGGA